MLMDSYPGQLFPTSSLYGRLALSTAGPSPHDLEPSSPLSDHSTLYSGQSEVTQSPSQGSQALPGTIGRSGNSTGPSGLLAGCLTAEIGPSGAPEATCDWHNIEGRHKDSQTPEPQDKYHDYNNSGDESKGSRVAEFVWFAKIKSSTHSRLHSAQKGES